MTGSLVEKSDRYYIVLNTRDADGRPKKKWISTGLPVKNNKRNAEEMLRNILDEYREETERAEERKRMILNDGIDRTISFVDFIEKWLQILKLSQALQQNTIQFYESMCRNHVIPYFKDMNLLLIEVTGEDLQMFINYEKRNGNRSLDKKKKSGLSPSSVKHIRTVLTQIFKEARKQHLITDNPCEFISIPRQIKRDVTVYDEDEIQEMLDKLKDEEIFPVIYVTLIFGLRRSEVCGLKWDSVNFRTKTVTVNHTVVRFSDIIEKDTTKTESSHRTYPLPPEIEDIFLKQREKEELGYMKYKEFYVENEYIFKKESGEPYNPDYISRKFSQLLKKHGLRHIRFHDLRHSCASYLISNGYQLKDIQEWLGHSDIQTTANIYAHLDTSRKKSLMEAMRSCKPTKED